jgi:hypothetical protein
MTTQNSCPTILQPLAQSNQAAPQSLPALNYTNQDFASLKTRLALFLEQRFANNFSDYFESDLGVVLAEIWAFLADMLSFKMDQNSQEVYIASVAQLDNAFAICQANGFQPTPPIASRALFSATINSTLSTDLSIPSGFQVTAGTVTYELYPADALNNPMMSQNIIIPAGAFSNTSIIGLQGQTFIDTFTSTGVVNQAFTLNHSPVIFDSVQVSVNGTTWTQVPYFTDSKPRYEYLVEYDSSYAASVLFGNSVAGYVPSQGSQIQITYRVGGGSSGNVVTGAFNIQQGFTVPGFQITVPVTFTNYTKGDFGYDGDTIADIRRKLPAFNKVQSRAVTGEDYQLNAELYSSPYNGQIGKATAVLRNYGCAGNIVDLFVLARSGRNGLVQANDQLKVELQQYMSEIQMITDYLCIKDGVVVYVDTLVDLVIPKFYKKFSAEIQAQAEQIIESFYQLANWEYGKILRASDLLQQLSGVQQVTNTTITFTTNNPDQNGDTVSPKYYEIIRPDTVNIVLTFE